MTSPSFLPQVMICVSLLNPLVLGSPVLEPDLDLSLRQLEPLRQLAPPGPADVLRAAVLHLQQGGLLLAEGGSLSPGPGILPSSASH